MKQCKTCMNREYKDKLTCCACAELFHAFHELFKQFPLFGKYVKTFECGSYMVDKKPTEFPEIAPEIMQQALRKELDIQSRREKFRTGIEKGGER